MKNYLICKNAGDNNYGVFASSRAKSLGYLNKEMERGKLCFPEYHDWKIVSEAELNKIIEEAA